MHIEMLAKSSVCPMTVKKICESWQIRFKIHRFSIRFKSDFCKFRTIQFRIKFDSIGLTILRSLSAFTGFIKCLVREQITPQLL